MVLDRELSVTDLFILLLSTEGQRANKELDCITTLGKLKGDGAHKPISQKCSYSLGPGSRTPLLLSTGQ